MAIRVLPEARDELRDALRYYRGIRPAFVGRALAARALAAFKMAMRSVEDMPLSRPEHPHIPGARFVPFAGFPYLAFYTVKDRDVIVVSVEYATGDYVVRTQEIAERGRQVLVDLEAHQALFENGTTRSRARSAA